LVTEKQLNKLKQDINRHFDREMELLDKLNKLKPKMTSEQHEDLIRTMASHPHAKRNLPLLFDAEVAKRVVEWLKSMNP